MDQLPDVVRRELEEMFDGRDCLGDPSHPPAYLYGRSSHAIQTEEGRTSIGRQLTTATEMAERHQRCVPFDMIFYDVRSGENMDQRPMILALLEEIQTGARSDIVFADTDIRVSRDPADYGHIIRPYFCAKPTGFYSLTQRHGVSSRRIGPKMASRASIPVSLGKFI